MSSPCPKMTKEFVSHIEGVRLGYGKTQKPLPSKSVGSRSQELDIIAAVNYSTIYALYLCSSFPYCLKPTASLVSETK